MTETEETGPSVDSQDPEERILARRLRIQRRQETQRRALLGEEENEALETEQKQTVSQKQMEESYIRLRKLHEDGFEMVTNIRVAGDAREVARRMEEEDTRRQRKEKLDAEAKAGAERFEEITRKWEVALQKEIPQDLHEMLTQQKMACDAMLDEKNRLITDYQAELKGKDDQYVRDLKKQAEDIDLLIERMENQIKELTKAYRHELEEIEKSFIMERTEMLEQQGKKWQQMMSERRQKEVDYMEAREKRVEEFEEQLQHLRIQDAEEYNQIKIKLETDVQILQQQLQQMKATYQLNQEKLEYNFQVLRKRDEENAITKSQQKRKITRLHDVLTNLKRKLLKQEKQYKDENQQLTSDYKHQLDQFRDVQRKAKTFMGSDARKFNQIWEMNEEECKKLAYRILDADRVIHEQQLGLPWTQPAFEFMDNVGPVMSEKDKAKGVSAKKIAEQVLTADKGTSSMEETVEQKSSYGQDQTHHVQYQEHEVETEETELSSTKALAGSRMPVTVSVSAAGVNQFSPQLIKQILELLCDESGFLIESKLLTLLAPLQHCEKTLMKLDAIFSAMGVESEEDVQVLSRYFVKFMKKEEETEESTAAVVGSAEEIGDEEAAQIDKADEPDVEPAEAAEVQESEKLGDKEPSELSPPEVGTEECCDKLDDADDADSLEYDAAGESGQDTSEERSLAPAPASPPELIDANDVLKALRAFVEENNKHRTSEPVDMTAWVNLTLDETDMAAGGEGSNAAATPTSAESATRPTSSPVSNIAPAAKRTSANAAKPSGAADIAPVSKEPKAITEMQKLLFEKSQMSNQFTIVNVNERDDSDDATYWENYHNIVTPEKEKVWDALLYSFEKYYDVLTSRAKLIEETDGLRQQNAELRILLHQYVSSKVNQELEVPPTRVLQLNQSAS